MSKKNIFFAYQSATKSGNIDNVDAIKSAIKKINELNDYNACSWEDLNHNGRILIQAIFEAIDKCDVFCCDLSYLNHNVLFELGYAISKNKKLFILLNENIINASSNYANIDVLRNISYSKFSNSADILSALNKLPDEPLLLKDLSVKNKNQHNTYDIFYISNSSNSQAQLDTYQFLSQSSYQVIFDDSSEVEYRPFKKYLDSILLSNAVIVHITSNYLSSSFEENAKASMLAGFACGMKKSVLIIAPYPYNAPIDYSDIMITYKEAKDCVDKVSQWIFKVPRTKTNELYEDTSLDLVKLGILYDIAENEKDQLQNYFIETNAYEYARNNKRAFFVGRKGAGKTAIYIMLNNMLKSDSNCYIIALKPESSELINNVEVALLYSSIAKEQSFFHAIWKFVIYSKMLLEIDNRLKSKIKYEAKPIEKEISNFADKNREILSKHFLEVIQFVHKNEGNMLQNIYTEYINPMTVLIKSFFSGSKYYKIAIIADNLDKTWDLKSDLRIQTSMLLNLFEVTGNIENELSAKESVKIDSKVILFLRKDIFEFILKEAREPDKIILSKQEIDWSDSPEQLKRLIEKRFSYVLDIPDDNDLDEVWQKYFDLKLSGHQTVFNKIQDVCLPRPRDFLMFMRNLFESAVNSNHIKVQESDFEKALKEYSEFLYQNLVAEMVSEYPNIRSILEHLHSVYIDKIKIDRLQQELRKFIEESKINNLIDALVINGYFRLANEKTGERYNCIKDSQKACDNLIRKFLWFKIRPRKVSIYAMLTPKYGRIKK